MGEIKIIINNKINNIYGRVKEKRKKGGSRDNPFIEDYKYIPLASI